MNSIFIGQRDTFQNDDNLFVIQKNNLARLDHFFKFTTEYPLSPPLQPNSLPSEIWSKILDILVMEYLKEFNYDLLARLLLVSKGYLMEFYKYYFGRDKHIEHDVGVVRCYFRISHTLETLDLILDLLTESFSCHVNLFLNPERRDDIPMPWDVLTVNRDFMGSSTPKIYVPSSKKIWLPNRYKIGDGHAFIAGSLERSIITPKYFRLPILIISISAYRSKPPLMTCSFLRQSHAWFTLSRLLRPGLGPAAGIYHSIKIDSLPSEFVFDDEVLIES